MFLVYPARRNNVTCVFQRGRDEYIELLRNGSEEKQKQKQKQINKNKRQLPVLFYNAYGKEPVERLLFFTQSWLR